MVCTSCDLESSKCNDGDFEWPCPSCQPKAYVEWCIRKALHGEPDAIIASVVSATEADCVDEITEAFQKHYNAAKKVSC